MPVGTAGAMKGMHWREVLEAGADIVLVNPYHLMLPRAPSALPASRPQPLSTVLRPRC